MAFILPIACYTLPFLYLKKYFFENVFIFKTKLYIYKRNQKKNIMLYVRTPLHGNEFKVCDEITDEVVAIFFNQQDAIDYVNWKTKKETRF